MITVFIVSTIFSEFVFLVHFNPFDVFCSDLYYFVHVFIMVFFSIYFVLVICFVFYLFTFFLLVEFLHLSRLVIHFISCVPSVSYFIYLCLFRKEERKEK